MHNLSYRLFALSAHLFITVRTSHVNSSSLVDETTLTVILHKSNELYILRHIQFIYVGTPNEVLLFDEVEVPQFLETELIQFLIQVLVNLHKHKHKQ